VPHLQRKVEARTDASSRRRAGRLPPKGSVSAERRPAVAWIGALPLLGLRTYFNQR